QMEAESIRVKAHQRLATRLESPSVRSLSPLFRSLSNSDFFGRREQITLNRLKHNRFRNLAGKVGAHSAGGVTALEIGAATVVGGARTSDDQTRAAMLADQKARQQIAPKPMTATFASCALL